MKRFLDNSTFTTGGLICHAITQQRPWTSQLVRDCGAEGPPRLSRLEARVSTIVYLDQNHWIGLAQSQHAPDKIADRDERSAAVWLSAQLRSGELVSPLSIAHFHETHNKRDPRQRRHLAEVMLDLSGDLYMCAPNSLQLREWSAVLAPASSAMPDRRVAFSTNANVVNGADATPRDDSDLGPDLNRWSARTAFGMMLKGPLIPDEVAAPGAAAAQGWVAEMARVRDVIVAENMPKEKRQFVAAYRLLQDIRMPLAEAGVSREAIVAYTSLILEDKGTQLLRDVRSLPYTGRFSEVLSERWASANDGWSDHDLFDLMYLSCAAGYADYVVAEKKMSHMLRKVENRVPPGATVVPKLKDLRARLEG